jgi:putative hydrolase of the HAD superfamily
MIDWASIDTVFLDMDGTLLDLYFDNHFWLEFIPKRYAEEHGLSYAEADQIMHEKYQRVIGTMDWYCVDYWTEQLSLDVEALKREIAHYIAVHPHVEEFLQRLHASDKQVWLVTNAHRKSLDLKMEKTSLDRYFDEIVCSHDYGLPKEDPAFWLQLRQDKPYNPERTLLAEDSLSVLQSAREYGIRHLLAITHPDSRQQGRTITDYPAVANFEDILSTLPPV